MADKQTGSIYDNSQGEFSLGKAVLINSAISGAFFAAFSALAKMNGRVLRFQLKSPMRNPYIMAPLIATLGGAGLAALKKKEQEEVQDFMKSGGDMDALLTGKPSVAAGKPTEAEGHGAGCMCNGCAPEAHPAGCACPGCSPKERANDHYAQAVRESQGMELSEPQR